MTEQSALMFESVGEWEQLPKGMAHADVADVAVDAHDHVYLFTRKEPRVFVYDADGRFLRAWGDGIFTPRPHGISISPDGNVYCVDEFDQTVRIFTPEGQQVGVIGTSGVTSDSGIDWRTPYRNFREQLAAIVRGAPPFNHPTKAGVAPDGDVYVSDGYGNASVHRFSPNGELVGSWGGPGSGPGEFRAPHSVVVHDERVWVCDRDNERIQIFDRDGRFIEAWTGLQRPSSVTFDAEGLVYVSEQGWKAGDYSWTRGVFKDALRASLCVLSPSGDILERLGGGDGQIPASFVAPHGLAVDSRGTIYVAEVIDAWYGNGSIPDHCPTLQVFARA